MTATGPRVADYLAHLLEAIDRIARYTAGMDVDAFRGSQVVQDAVIRNLQVVGEASRNILRDDPGFAAAHATIPLAAAYEMRNALSHGYFKIDLGIVWRTLQRDLPALRKRAQVILTSLQREPPAAP